MTSSADPQDDDLPELSLVEWLQRANEEFQSAEHGGRQGVILALSAVILELRKIPEIADASLQAPLVRLLADLSSLDSGAVSDLLAPAQISVRPIEGLMRAQLIGTVAYIAWDLHRRGMRRSDAHEAIAETLRKANVPTRGGNDSITARTVSGWCQKVRTDVGRVGLEAQEFYHLVDMPSAEGEEQWTLEIAEKVHLDRLWSYALTFGHGKKAPKVHS